MSSYRIHLGFPEPFTPASPLPLPSPSQPFTFLSKLGGLPVWLNPTAIPGADDLKCPVCDKTMSLLLQLYAPLDHPEAYHRMLYFFICSNGRCLKARFGQAELPCLLLRQQLPKENPLYMQAPAEDGEEVDEDDDLLLMKPDVKPMKRCRVSGLHGRYFCAKCKLVDYAGKEFQAYDWKRRHRVECDLIEKGQAKTLKDAELMVDARQEFDTKAGVFREFEIETEEAEEATQLNPSPKDAVVDSDEDDSDEDEEELSPEVAERNAKLVEEHAKNTEQFGEEFKRAKDLGPQQPSVKDNFFKNFQRITADFPEQILRYYEQPDIEPLWLNASEQLAEVPPCSCGAKRRCEFQILPQILYALKIEDFGDTALDFGTLVGYTCSQSCSLGERKWARELVWAQYINAAVYRPDEAEDE